MEEQAEDADERRLNRVAYEYLCRCAEIRTWLVDCLQDESIAPVSELEENLRNGVILARLGHFFAPDIVTEKGIFDKTQEKYNRNEKQPVYRHSDNIMHWRRAMESVNLPEIFIPETTDVFEGRNMKTVFCLFALATLLHRQRKSPAIRNLAGKAKFSTMELKEMRENLKDSNVPEFSDVGNMLSDRKNNADAQKVVMNLIKEAVEANDCTKLVEALKAPNSGIDYVEKELSEAYLREFKTFQLADEYRTIFVQSVVNRTNDESALKSLDALLSPESCLNESQLLAALDLLQLEDVRQFAIRLYYDLLREMQKENNGERLDKDQVFAVISHANGLVEVKIAVEHGSSEDVLKTLENRNLNLRTSKSNAKLYYNSLRKEYNGAGDDYYLRREYLQKIIEEFEDISPEKIKALEVNQSISRDDKDGVIQILSAEHFSEIYIEENIEFYIKRMKLHIPQNINDIRHSITYVNDNVERGFKELEKVINLNKAIFSKDELTIKESLSRLLETLKSPIYREELKGWYLKRLQGIERVRDVNNKSEKWLDHDIEIGKVWMETESLKRSSSELLPIEETFLSWNELEEIFKVENCSFDKYYKEKEVEVIKSQLALRKYLQKKRVNERLKIDKEKEIAATKIQQKYKSYRQKQDLVLLRTSKHPSLSLVRKFVKQLPRTEVDFSDDLEVANAKTEVTRLLASNRQLDSDLVEMDEKIGLLIKNRLNLHEVIAHRDRTAETVDTFSENEMSNKKQRGKSNVLTLEQLLYGLQTKPIYLANLIEESEHAFLNMNELIMEVVCPIFGFLSDNREQFLLVRLLCEFINRQIRSSNKLDEFQTTKIPKLCDFFRLGGFDNIIDDPCHSISEELTNFMDEESRVSTFHLEPVELYESLYKQKVENAEKALQDEQVSDILSKSLNFLAKWSEILMDAILAKFELPKSCKYLTLFLDAQFRNNFPSATQQQIDQTIALFTFKIFFSSQLVSVRRLFKILGKQPTDDAIHRLECIIQFVEFAVVNKGYGNKKWYLSSLNAQIHKIHHKFINYIDQNVRQGALDDIYSMNEFTQFDPFHKPTLSLIDKHVQNIVNCLKKNKNLISTDKNDIIIQLIEQTDIPHFDEDKMIVFQLHPSANEFSEDGSELQSLTSAKKWVVALLLCEVPGKDLLELVESEPTEENNLKYHEIFPNGGSVKADQENLKRDLEGLVREEKSDIGDKYQSVVTSIANDIRLHKRRQRERSEQRKSIAQTKRKLLEQREDLKEKMIRYEEYLETCLQNLSRTSRRLSFRPNTKEAGKIQKQRASLDQIKSYKSSAEKLFRKGVIVDVIDYQSPKKLSKLSIEISSTEKQGTFSIKLMESGKIVDTVVLHFQELLKSESVDETTFLIDDKMVLDVAKTIQYINKKFFNN